MGARPDRNTAGSHPPLGARYTQARDRLQGTVAGHLHRRIVEVDLMNQAMILAALAFMLLVPVLISIAAVVPLGASGGNTAALAHRLGLSDAATHDVQQLFPSRKAVRADTTAISTALSVLSAFAWPIALQRGYELAWGLPPAGWRSLWRPVVWLVSFAVLGTLYAVFTPIFHGWLFVLLAVIIGFPITFAWAWATQHLLLAGRVGWRLLLPGAVAMAVGLVGLRLLLHAFLSRTITSHFQEYGPLGVVFVLLSWFVAFSVIVLGGGVIGAGIHEHRERRGARSSVRGEAGAAPQPPSSGSA
jgi:membrane protein